ncbi:MAG: NAD-dependent epimerase/dehydratase family protein [Clostridiales bacterium]|nr:NAD-dependent epimerase/dehydratase family protein [Clostridiales bacterium]MBQ1744074.1 NAD-dependent epimerase/dehydratase family protein [Clostridiales bacterium]MBQ2154847.1 NAD-dependent epimerase/dehydratase family protein [Clostridiales bacterium]MBQ5520253.1 NAD-dependent epimerase/dehydratase family protein [Clostridiales bacterium]
MLYDNKNWIEDIDKVIEVVPELDELAGKSLMITGAAGLVCSAVVDIIFRYNDTHDKKIQVLAAGRWPEEMSGRFGDLVNRDDFTFVVYDASKTDNVIDVHSDYIIHGASNASPNMIVKEPVETMMSNFLGMKYLLDYAKDQGTKRILYISSSEVYGEKEGTEPYKEGQYGYIDLLKARNSYSVGKRAAETLCASYADEYGVESVIVRPGHIYGPTASPYDNRVASAWSYAVAKGEDIVMKSDGAQIRSYCYCLDCASAMLKVLLCGENCHAYNISNPDSIISIKQMAEILVKSAGVKLRMELPTDEERKGFNPMSNSSLESTSLTGLGWRGCFDAEAGFTHTVQILKETYGL